MTGTVIKWSDMRDQGRANRLGILIHQLGDVVVVFEEEEHRLEAFTARAELLSMYQKLREVRVSKSMVDGATQAVIQKEFRLLNENCIVEYWALISPFQTA